MGDGAAYVGGIQAFIKSYGSGETFNKGVGGFGKTAAPGLVLTHG
jgi:hypothetical protein